jgi:DNA-binding transcriptional regulator YiaG
LKKEEYDEIMSLTNPAVKKRLLETFADGADSAAVHLKAFALPGQTSQVLLPFTSLKEHEVYAPNFVQGENVVLIRHPHGGTFEIPELIVNNKNPEAKRLIGNAKDAVGINPKVALRLSGADFDGDAVLVIPNKNGSIKSSSPIKSIVEFEPKITYKKVPGMKVMKEATKQREMGEISNLITDMTIKGANENEIARAVKHSMVVIDAVKHELNYQQSFVDNNIAQLKKKYQGREDGGASTIISRAKSKRWINDRKEGILIDVIDSETGKVKIDPKTGKPKKKRIFVDPATGKKLYEETGKVLRERKKVVDPVTGKKRYIETGKIVPKQIVTTKMAEEEDAFNLSSGTPMESIYARHANSMKALGNKARKAALETEPISYSPSARDTYSNEVASLRSKLKLAFMNKPRERQAQLLAGKVISTKRREDPDIEPSELKKLRGQTTEEMRARVGAKKVPVEITDREWEAIQAGAVSNNVLSQILLNTKLDKLKQRAMPHYTATMSPARIARARSMLELGHTTGEIAEALGVSKSALEKSL